MCVPLRSPRDTNGALAALIFFKASRISRPPEIFAGSALGPIRTKSLYITSKRLTPWPSARNFSSADRDHAHLDPGLLPENRQHVAEQSRLLGRGRRGNDDELFLRQGGQGGEHRN